MTHVFTRFSNLTSPFIFAGAVRARSQAHKLTAAASQKRDPIPPASLRSRAWVRLAPPAGFPHRRRLAGHRRSGPLPLVDLGVGDLSALLPPPSCSGMGQLGGWRTAALHFSVLRAFLGPHSAALSRTRPGLKLMNSCVVYFLKKAKKVAKWGDILQISFG